MFVALIKIHEAALLRVPATVDDPALKPAAAERDGSNREIVPRLLKLAARRRIPLSPTKSNLTPPVPEIRPPEKFVTFSVFWVSYG